MSLDNCSDMHYLLSTVWEKLRCGFCCKQCLSKILPILQPMYIKTVAVHQPHPLAVNIKAAMLIMLTLMQAMVAFVVRSAYPTYSTLYCLNLNGAPAVFLLRQYLKKITHTLM